ncbi:MAG: hypothetical protein IJB79_06185 [Candidatus Gastranaerophilales bacterium]|nr:hypothetical protein [Candidatus Gastranaerophilales bacterium]
METTRLSQANQAYIERQKQNNAIDNPVPQFQQIEDGKNKINKALVALGILATAGITIGCIIHGKKVKAPKSDDVSKLVKQFQDIDFNKGTAKLKDGTLFSGAIEDTLKSGDKVVMEYTDGVLQKSTKTTKGAEIVKEYSNGIISKKNGQVIDIKKIQNEVKIQQKKLGKILADKNLTSDELKKQTDEIKFKSKKQEVKIKETFDKKIQAQETAKKEAEKLAQEAQEKAQKEEAIRVAKEKQETKIKAEKESEKKIKCHKFNCNDNEQYDEFNKFASRSNSDIIRLSQGETLVYGGVEIKPEQLNEMCAEADEFIKKVQPTTEEFVCFRDSGIKSNYKKYTSYQTYIKAKVGDIIQPEPGYAYAAIDKDVFAKKLGTTYGDYIKAKIIVPSGSKIACSGGSEVIFPRNSKFELVKKDMGAKGEVFVTLKYIEQNV